MIQQLSHFDIDPSSSVRYLNFEAVYLMSTTAASFQELLWSIVLFRALKVWNHWLKFSSDWDQSDQITARTCWLNHQSCCWAWLLNEWLQYETSLSYKTLKTVSKIHISLFCVQDIMKHLKHFQIIENICTQNSKHRNHIAESTALDAKFHLCFSSDQKFEKYLRGYQ